MKQIILLSALLGVVLGVCLSAQASALPPITGTPVIDAPNYLAWPADRGTLEPNLNDSTANLLQDLHGHMDNCDLVLSSEGNYHPALQDIWPVFLAKFKDRPLKNWMYTTSPPVVVPQLAHGLVQFGNFLLGCRPSVAVASGRVINALIVAGVTEGKSVPLYTDRGSVILVKHGNPKKIRTVWDLGRDDVQFVTPNPVLEKGAFANYAGTLYGIARQDAHAPAGETADDLFNKVFNSTVPGKWLAGARIHHRDIPWSIAYGHADAALLFSHLARYTQQSFPDLFDIVPLGGTVDDPQPLPGSLTGTRYLVRIKGDWNARQIEAREVLIETLRSPTFTGVLVRRGLLRPAVAVTQTDAGG